EEWITEGCSNGWVLLTKDKRIRYRAEELEALQEGHLFCLVSGNLDIAQMTQAFLDALPRIERAATEESVGFWHVYRDGQIKRMWPGPGALLVSLLVSVVLVRTRTELLADVGFTLSEGRRTLQNP